MTFSKIFYIFLFGLIVLCGLFLLATLFPIPGNYEVRVVKSGSMEPAIHTGSIVVIKPSEHYGEGDVITFNQGTQSDMPTTHRIVEVQESSGARSYITKGDANDDEDAGAVEAHQVMGKVVATVPWVGYVIDAARKPLGFFLLIMVPMALIAFEALATIWKEVRGIQKKKEEEPTTKDT